MNTLTCAELCHYPGTTFTEQLRAHHRERERGAATPAAGASRVATVRVPRVSHGALPLARRIDLGRFTGRDRAERLANYLRAHLPRTETWSDESLRDFALRLLATAEFVAERRGEAP